MFIDFLFMWINFGTLLLLLVYLYRKYGRQMLIEHMATQEEAIRVLQLKELALKQEKERLAQDIQDEQRLAAHLLQKAKEWRAVQEQKEVEKQEAQQDIQQLLHKKAEKQAEWYAQHQLAHRLFPQVLKKTRGVLNGQFTDSQKEAAYLEEIVTYMKKSQS